MNYYVADTHGLYWYLIASPLLGANAKNAFDEGKNGNAIIYIRFYLQLGWLFFVRGFFSFTE